MQDSTLPLQHTTVLLHEGAQALWPLDEGPHPEGVYVDATFGRGGHSRLILSQLPPTARLLALDRDPAAIAHATTGADAIADPRFRIEHAAFSSWGHVVSDLGLGPVDGILMDIGVSSPQIDTPERGFSFRFDAPLDMRMDTTQGESAADYLLRATVDELTHVIHTYGEERFARPVAKAIVAGREAGNPVRTTFELSRLVAGAVKTREAGQNPATRGSPDAPGARWASGGHQLPFAGRPHRQDLHCETQPRRGRSPSALCRAQAFAVALDLPHQAV